jgi:DNA polymerase-3 subunit gamma/tau
MAETIYRKYRPQTFADLIGQRAIRLTLEQALTNNRLAHAYLFTGPRGVGKTTTARLLARAVNCLNRGSNPEPCDECRNCQALLDGRSMDVMEIDAASQTGVDNVRENIIQSARTLPGLMTMKVFIIDEVHMLSIAAFNALLKLLEEPPAHAMFILATTEVHRVPETIISRTQRFDFQRIPLEEITARLTSLATREHRRLATGVAERIARQAGGSQRDAESMLGQLFAFAETEIDQDLADLVLPRSDHQLAMELLALVMADRAAAALALFHRYLDEGGDVPTLVRDILSVARTVLLARVDPSLVSSLSRTEDAASIEKMIQLSTGANPTRQVAIIEAFSEAQRYLSSATIEELPVELAIINSCTPPDEQSPTAPPPVTAKTPDTPPAPTNPKKTPTRGGQLTVTEVAQAWVGIQADPALPPGLALSVKQARVVDFVDQTIILEAPYRLHSERLNQLANVKILRAKLGDLLGDETLNLETRLNPDMTVSAPAPITETKAEPKTIQTANATEGDDLWGRIVNTFETT